MGCITVTTTHLEWESSDSSFHLWGEPKPREDEEATRDHTAAGG